MTKLALLASAFTSMMATPTITEEVKSEQAQAAILRVIDVLNSFDLAEVTAGDREAATELVNNRLVIDPTNVEQMSQYSALVVRAATIRYMLEQGRVSIRSLYQHPEFLKVMQPLTRFLIQTW